MFEVFKAIFRKMTGATTLTPQEFEQQLSDMEIYLDTYQSYQGNPFQLILVQQPQQFLDYMRNYYKDAYSVVAVYKRSEGLGKYSYMVFADNIAKKTIL